LHQRAIGYRENGFPPDAGQQRPHHRQTAGFQFSTHSALDVNQDGLLGLKSVSTVARNIATGNKNRLFNGHSAGNSIGAEG
jgi:hypothetical protein